MIGQKIEESIGPKGQLHRAHAGRIKGGVGPYPTIQYEGPVPHYLYLLCVGFGRGRRSLGGLHFGLLHSLLHRLGADRRRRGGGGHSPEGLVGDIVAAFPAQRTQRLLDQEGGVGRDDAVADR